MESYKDLFDAIENIAIQYAVVVTRSNHDDDRDFFECVADLALCPRGWGAHVYAVPERQDLFVVTALPLTKKQIEQVVDDWIENHEVGHALDCGVPLEEALKLVSERGAKRSKLRYADDASRPIDKTATDVAVNPHKNPGAEEHPAPGQH